MGRRETPGRESEKTANEHIFDEIVRADHDLQALQNRRVARLLSVLRKAEKEVATTLRNARRRNGSSLSDWRRTRLRSVQDAILEEIQAAWGEASGEVRDLLPEVAEASHESTLEALRRGIPDPAFERMDLVGVPRSALDEIVNARFGDLAWGERWDLAGRELRSATAQSVAQSFALGEGVRDLSKRIQKTYRGALGMSRAESIARTEAQRVLNRARTETFRRNRDVLRGETWIATLDERTCIRCSFLDGTTWLEPRPGVPIPPHPEPPIHPMDRCSLTPVARSARDLGFSQDEIDANPILRSLTGEPAASIPYPEFLARQDGGFQNDVLGRTRAEWFRKELRDGKPPESLIADFVSATRSNVRVLNLDQFRRRLRRQGRTPPPE